MTEAEQLELQDVMQIQRLKATYCWASDAAVAGPAAVGDAFDRLLADDVTADYGFGPIHGREALTRYMLGEIGANMDSLWHAIHTPRIEVDGDTARAGWTLIVRMKTKGAAETGMLFGRYEDEFRRTPQGWRMSRIQWVGESLASGLPGGGH